MGLKGERIISRLQQRDIELLDTTDNETLVFNNAICALEFKKSSMKRRLLTSNNSHSAIKSVHCSSTKHLCIQARTFSATRT